MTSVRDIIIVIVIFFVVGISSIFIVFTGHTINAQLVNVTQFNNTPYAKSVIQHSDTALNMSDYLYLALFIGFYIGIIIFAWYIGGEPIWAPIYLFILIIFCFVAIILQLVWGDISLTQPIATTIIDLPITNWVLSNLAYVTAVFGLTAILIMYGKPVTGGG